MAARMSEATTALTKCGSKSVGVGIEVGEDFGAFVYLYRNNSVCIRLTGAELHLLHAAETKVNVFFRSDSMEYKMPLTLSDSLRIRFDLSYNGRMVVLERQVPEESEESGSSEPPAKKPIQTPNLWYVEKTWSNLMELMPLLKHAVTKRESHLARIRGLVVSIALNLRLQHPIATGYMEQSGNMHELYRLVNPQDYQKENTDDGFDAVETVYELCIKHKDKVLQCLRNVGHDD